MTRRITRGREGATKLRGKTLGLITPGGMEPAVIPLHGEPVSTFVDSDQFSRRQKGLVENSVNIALLALAITTAVVARSPLATQQGHHGVQSADFSYNTALLKQQAAPVLPFISDVDDTNSPRKSYREPDNAPNLVSRLPAPATKPFVSVVDQTQPPRKSYREPDQSPNLLVTPYLGPYNPQDGGVWEIPRHRQLFDDWTPPNLALTQASGPTPSPVTFRSAIFTQQRGAHNQPADIAPVFPASIPAPPATLQYFLQSDLSNPVRKSYREPDQSTNLVIRTVQAVTFPFVSQTDVVQPPRKTYREPDPNINLLVTPYLGLYNPQDFGEWAQHRGRRVYDSWTPPNLALTQATQPTLAGQQRVALTTQQRGQHFQNNEPIYNSVIYNVPPTPPATNPMVWNRHRPGRVGR